MAAARQKPARNKYVFLWFWVGVFLAFVGEFAKHAYKQVPWLLCSRRTVLVDSYNHIFDTNKLLILNPYYPDSICFLNMPLVIILQIQQWY